MPNWKVIGGFLVGAITLIAGIDYFFDGAIKSRVDGLGLEWLGPLIVSPLFSIALGVSFLFVLVWSAWRKWDTWCNTFLYAGKGRDLDLKKVAPSRLMQDIKYVPIKRTLEHPRRLEQPVLETMDDAESFFLTRLQHPAFLQAHWGFLVEGTTLVGKTRFVGEWIRRHFPDAFVLVPDPTNVPPEIPGRLRRKSQVCLLLDDLDEFREHVAVWCRWIETLRDGKGSILVWSTVRDGGPGYEVQDTPAFRPIRENLEHVVLARLSREQQEEVGRQTGILHQALPRDREPTFAWLLEREFQEARRRYHTQLEPADRTLLQAAALLERCNIPIRSDLWLRAAKQVFDFPEGPSNESEALHRLRQQGFLQRGVPEPAYLRHVVTLTNFNALILALDKEGIRSAVVTFSTLISKAPSYGEAEKWFDKMIKAKVRPNVVTFGALFSRNLADIPAEELLDWYLNQSYHPANPLQAAITGYYKLHRLDDALYLALNYPYLETVLKGVCYLGRNQGASHVLTKLRQREMFRPRFPLPKMTRK